jgi:Glycosyltransferase (GlcNAc)
VGYELPNRIPNETRGTVLEMWKFDGDGVFRQKSRFLSADELSHAQGPIKTHLFAAGFNFALSSIVVDCPYQDLPHLFVGEESSMAVRLFVRGYDLYAPVESVCCHLWGHSYNPRTLDQEESNDDPTMNEMRRRLREASMSIVQAQITRPDALPAASSSAALVRDLESFGAVIGVDFRARQIRRGDVSAPRDDEDQPSKECFISL